MAQLTLEMPESAFGTLHPFTESAEKTAWVFSDGGIRNIRLLPASRVGFRGICKELAGDFEARHGFLRKEVQSAVFSFFQYPEVPCYPDPPAPDF